MATYKKLIVVLEPFQEGNRADIGVEVDVTKLSLTGLAASCELREKTGKLLWRKKTADSTMTIAGQLVTIPLAPADTKGKPGVHNFEIDFLNAQNEPFATIGATLTIEAQINTNG